MIEITITIKDNIVDYESKHIANRASDNELLIEDKISHYVMVNLCKNLKKEK